MPANKGTYHLTDNPTLYEPARTNNFEFVVTGLDSLLEAGVDEATATNSDYITNAQEVIRVSVSSSSVPHFTLGDVSIKRGNSTVHFAGTPTFSSTSLVLNDYIGARTKSVLLAWQALCYNVREDTVGRAADYKKNCTLIEYTPDYKEVVRYWDLIGCWISALNETGFNNENNDNVQVTATITYDRAIPHLPDDLNLID